ncbi:hypothetical protein NEOLEDRAFT_1182206 [Neolentinus lepideus HHB14362 ss-1]|uniref:Uncharacterized protein n=1 Tax=Neolentinus lepideus HHB14362 ss-1 TaxID=1314782 RepID=A0A165PDK9_9AGAM|nr:hypothetical protein NEOLEDRAFT_1182206 [Neolentinus lepideus HHB14362 ss-1]
MPSQPGKTPSPNPSHHLNNSLSRLYLTSIPAFDTFPETFEPLCLYARSDSGGLGVSSTALPPSCPSHCFMMDTSIITVASRQSFAFSRDGALPFFPLPLPYPSKLIKQSDS